MNIKAKLFGRDHEFREPTQRREQLIGSEDLSGELSRRTGRAQPTKDEAEARKDFWSIHVDFIYRHHIEARVQLCVPKEETVPIPLKYIDVTRATLQIWTCCKKNVLTSGWNVDVHRSLSDSWKGFTRFIHSIERETSQGRYVVRGETDKNSSKGKAA